MSDAETREQWLQRKAREYELVQIQHLGGGRIGVVVDETGAYGEGRTLAQATAKAMEGES